MADELVHRWYTSVMGFTPKLVREAMEELGCNSSGLLLDPFCGTGTTLVESRLKGVDAIGVDANPFMRFCSAAKTRLYVRPTAVDSALHQVFAQADDAKIIMSANKSEIVKKGWVSAHIWSSAQCLYDQTGSISDAAVRKLIQLAIISAVKEYCANVAFGPEIYKRARPHSVKLRWAVSQKVKQMTDDLVEIELPLNKSSMGTFLGDARELDFLIDKGLARKVQWIITSPPYPTEHDYSRITRLELVLGGFVESLEDLQLIKKRSLRSNSKSIYAGDNDGEYVKKLSSVTNLVKSIQDIANTKTDGFARQYPKVIDNYFGGLARHLTSASELMKPGGQCLYVLSEQRSYFGILVPTVEIFIEIACEMLKSFELVKRTTVKFNRSTRGTVGNLREEAVVLKRR
jgi:hypothetical protein